MPSIEQKKNSYNSTILEIQNQLNMLAPSDSVCPFTILHTQHQVTMTFSGLTQKGNFGVDTVRRHIHKVQIFFNLSRMGHTHTQDLEGPCLDEWLQQLHRYIHGCVRTCTHTLKDHHSSPQIKHAHLHTVSDQGRRAHNKEGSSQFMQNHKDHHCTMHYNRVTPQLFKV